VFRNKKAVRTLKKKMPSVKSKRAQVRGVPAALES